MSYYSITGGGCVDIQYAPVHNCSNISSFMVKTTKVHRLKVAISGMPAYLSWCMGVIRCLLVPVYSCAQLLEHFIFYGKNHQCTRTESSYLWYANIFVMVHGCYKVFACASCFLWTHQRTHMMSLLHASKVASTLFGYVMTPCTSL